MAGKPLSYTEEQAREAIATSYSWAESLRELGLCSSGGAWRVLKKYAEVWDISTDHFEPARHREANLKTQKRPIEELLVEHSTCSRQNLKRRLYQEGLKVPRCEICGQDENWRGRHMAMILDHINGVRDDNRIENLQIVCPNCAATLDTHCGRKNRVPKSKKSCRRCGRSFLPGRPQQRYCSRECGTRWDRSKLRGRPTQAYRRVKRPPYEQLLAEIEATSYCAVGRKYGVSDNAVRKWVRFYERERERTD
ncbi:MAG TPA: HNH endonuclease signature motif containing protein [Solirubrobacterales bacterium]|nr:HNH endonuclease signature motif containing protein [Solirubrobacterales bacterium]